jgi:putative tricarboxylic transport membrane protein
MSEGVNPSPKGTLAGFPIHTRNLAGGLTVVVLGLLLLGYAIYVEKTSPAIVPMIMAAVVTVVGLGVTFGLIPVAGPRDFYGGIVFIDLAILALIASAELPGQRGFAFGPGTAPRLFAILLIGLSAAVALGGIFVQGERIEKYKLRGPILVVLSILAFALMIRGFTFYGITILPPLGLIPSTFLAFMLSILGSKEMRLLESLIAATVMTIFCWALFVLLLNLPFQLWPRI